MMEVEVHPGRTAMESPMKPLPASNGPRPHRCEVCQRSFREIATLRKHEQLHRADRPYVCTTCGKSFLWSSNLKVHERVHTGERPYKCKICHRCFTQSNDLRRHERNVHMRGKLYGYKSGRNAAQPDSQQVNLAAYQAFAMQQRALLQQALTYESYLQKAAGVGGVGVSGAAAAAQLFHHSQQQQQQAAAAMGSGGGAGPPPRGPPGAPDGAHGPAPPPPSSASPRSPLKLEQVTPPATPSDMENELKRGALPPTAHNSSSSTSPHERDLGLASPGRGGSLATSMPLVAGVMHSPPNLLPGHYSAMKTEGLDLVTRAGSLPSFSSFRPMHRSLDGLQALTMSAALGPRGAPAPHHPHMPPASTSSAVNGPLRVSPPHHYHRNPHHHPSPSHLSPVGSEGGGNGGILSPHHHHNLGQHHLHHDGRSRHDMMGYHHQHPQHHHDHQPHHGSGRNSGDGSSSGHHPDVTTTNGPRRLSSPSSRRSVSPMDTDSRRDRRDSDLAASGNGDSGRRSSGDVDGDGRSSSRRSVEYDRNGEVGDAGDRDVVAPDGGDAYHHHRRHLHHDEKDGGPQMFRSRSASRDGYSREPHLERSLSDHLHPDNSQQRQYHRSRSVSPDYRHHHHQQQQHRYPSPHSHLSHHERHFNHLEDELHKRSPPTATITSGSTPGSNNNNNNNNNSSTPYPCDSVMDLSMSKPPPPTSASPPSRASSAASSSHVVDKEVAGVNNSSSSSAAATIMPPPRTPTSAGATTPTSMHHPNGSTLSGLLQLAAATATPLPPQHHAILTPDGESEPGKRDVTTTSATPTLSGTGADSSIHHCQHCNIFFYDYTMFHLHESLHLPYEDHPFRCPSCGTHCQDKIEFMFHTVWHVKYPHTIPNYAPFRERVLASSSSP